MGVAGFTMGVVMLAFKCLPFSRLNVFRLISRRKVLRGRVLRIVDCVAF